MPKTRMWARVEKPSATLAAGDSITDLFASYVTEVGILELRGKTIATVIGNLVVVAADLPPNASNSQSRWTAGIAVFSKGMDADDTPIPGTDTYPWMWYYDRHQTYLSQPVVGFAGAELYCSIEQVLPIHIRAMRKLAIGQTLMLKIHNYSGTDLNIAFGGSALLLG